ncbi:ABC transporter permease subunit [Paenibacillus sp. HB172176]|uniref:ABC transporter permease n=1 Tax=Paenibacillus sp. HB172176 TaxID=2493690 RepID=UPI001F0F70FE|nr:ABC transporter permease subunit [Paenibacillus sp. HB172176]
MVLPTLVYFFLFKYLPMLGLVIAFKDYQPFLGFIDSPWVGLEHFQRFFTADEFGTLFRNTMLISFYRLLFFFPFPIIISLMLNEVRLHWFKRTVQTVIYIPHFLSWIVIVGITYVFFTTEGGLVNELIAAAGGTKINFLGGAEWIRTMLTAQSIWHDAGWGTIIYLAAMSNLNPQLYEAARIDGAGRFHQMWNVTLPGIRSTIIILFILQLGHFMDLGFEQIFNMINPSNRVNGDVYDTYVYVAGITQGQFSYSTAVGLFKSAVGLVLVVAANRIVKWFGEEGVY